MSVLDPKKMRVKLDEVDPKTREAYNLRAFAFAEDYESQTPERLHELMRSFFLPGGLCLDVGCGSGRDVAWLSSLGFAASGLDASENLLLEAVSLHPGLDFYLGALPDLDAVGETRFDNVLCSGVLMHLPEGDIVGACASLLRVLKNSGTLVLSFRASRNPHDSREEDGRLYTALEPTRLISLFESLGAKLVRHEESLDGRQLRWQTLVLRKSKDEAE